MLPMLVRFPVLRDCQPYLTGHANANHVTLDVLRCPLVVLLQVQLDPASAQLTVSFLFTQLASSRSTLHRLGCFPEVLQRLILVYLVAEGLASHFPVLPTLVSLDPSEHCLVSQHAVLRRLVKGFRFC